MVSSNDGSETGSTEQFVSLFPEDPTPAAEHDAFAARSINLSSRPAIYLLLQVRTCVYRKLRQKYLDTAEAALI